MKLEKVKGATSQSVLVFIRDSSATTGAGLTGLVFNSGTFVASYCRPGAARQAITLATQTVTGAWSSGGFVEIDSTNMPGVYRLDVPDAVFATGVDSAVVMLKGATNQEPCVLEFALTGVNMQDAVRGGMTALPNANAEAAGGLYTRGTGAGQINQDANGRVDSNAAAAGGTAWGSGAITAGAIATDAIGAAELATDAVTEIVNAVLAGIIEGSITLQQSMRLHNSALGAICSGLATANPKYRDLANSKDRISATADVDGNRSAVTLDLT